MPYVPPGGYDFAQTDPRKNLDHFFMMLWGPVEQAYARFATLSQPSQEYPRGEFKNYKFDWADEQAHKDAINFVIEQSALGQNVFYSPALFDKDKVDTALSLDPNLKVYIKENVKLSNVLWAEHDGSREALGATLTAVGIDPVTGSQLASEAGKSALTDSTEARSLVPRPTVRMQSSGEGREHWIWVLDDSTSDMKRVEAFNRAIAQILQFDLGGWDAGQVLRVPYTLNYKYPQKPIATISYHYEDNVYALDNFTQVPPAKETISHEIDPEGLPSVDELIVTKAWSLEEFELITRKQIPVGDRSGTLMRVAHICAESGLKAAEIYAVIQHCDKRWGKYYGRSDAHTRYVSIVDTALTKHPHALSELTFGGLLGIQEENANYNRNYRISELLELNREVTWAVTDFMPHNGFGILTAAPGIGKTQLSLQLAYSCATGNHFLEWQPVKPMRILFYSLEMDDNEMRGFVSSQMSEYDAKTKAVLDENMLFNFKGALPVEIPEVRAYIEKEVAEFRPQGIIIDSMNKLTNKKLDEETSRTINNFLQKLRRRYDCFVWVVHHNRKATADNKRPNSLDDTYGSIYFTAEPSIAVTLWTPDRRSDSVEFIVNKMRLAKTPPIIRLRRGENLLYTVIDDNDYITEANFENITNEGVKDAGTPRSNDNF